jgi:glutamate carboxypeptidase
VLSSLIAEISSLGRPAEGLIVNFGPLQGGTATNVVPDLARAWANVRFADPPQWEAFAKRLLALAAAPATAGKVRVEVSVGRPAKPLSPAVERFAHLCRGAAEHLGQKLPFSKTAGVCDGNLMQAAGLPTLDTLGVRGGGLHTPHEWIELSSLVERCQLLAVVMMRAAASSK